MAWLKLMRAGVRTEMEPESGNTGGRKKFKSEKARS
jgi:hypothetical protein